MQPQPPPEVIRVGEGGGFAGNSPQPKPGGAVVIGRLQPPVVEPERFARRILEVKLAVIVPGEVPCGKRMGSARFQAAVEKPSRIG